MYFFLCLFFIKVILYTTPLSHYSVVTCQSTIESTLVKRRKNSNGEFAIPHQHNKILVLYITLLFTALCQLFTSWKNLWHHWFKPKFSQYTNLKLQNENKRGRENTNHSSLPLEQGLKTFCFQPPGHLRKSGNPPIASFNRRVGFNQCIKSWKSSSSFTTT